MHSFNLMFKIPTTGGANSENSITINVLFFIMKTHHKTLLRWGIQKQKRFIRGNLYLGCCDNRPYHFYDMRISAGGGGCSGCAEQPGRGEDLCRVNKRLQGHVVLLLHSAEYKRSRRFIFRRSSTNQKGPWTGETPFSPAECESWLTSVHRADADKNTTDLI